MPLKAFVKSLDEIPEAFRSEYTKSGDGFVLNLEDKDYKSKIEEFRNNNLTLTQKERDLQQRLDQLKDIDPKKYQELLAFSETMDKNEEMKLIKDGKFEEVIKKRLESVEKPYKDKIRDLESKLGEQTKKFESVFNQYSDMQLSTMLSKAIDPIGVPRKGAMLDIANRAKGIFKVNDDGTVENVGGWLKDGRPGTIEEWAKSLPTEAAYFFESSGGGGAQGSKQQRNLNDGTKLISNDPELLGQNIDGIIDNKVRVSNG